MKSIKKSAASVISQTNRYIIPTYARYPLVMTKGKGAWLWDIHGKKYLDFLAGVAVNNLGYQHPQINKVIKDQTNYLLHTSNLLYTSWQADFAKKLVDLTDLYQCFLCNSGAEAVEAAIKLARYYSIGKFGPHKYEIIVFQNSFHGRTLGALSATAQKKYQQGFGPLVKGFKVIPFNQIDLVKKNISKKTCAVLVEPIQGEGGVNIPSPDYLRKLSDLCHQKNILLICDEVQVGIGRTGYLLASHYYKAKPHLITLAKGLGSGMPLGACVVDKRIAQVAKPGVHASTFGGNPLACRIGLETLKIISREIFLKQVRQKGKLLLKLLTELKKSCSEIKEVRGLGLMVAVEFKTPIAKTIHQEALKRGLILNPLGEKILRFVPPLIISKKEIRWGVGILRKILNKLEL